LVIIFWGGLCDLAISSIIEGVILSGAFPREDLTNPIRHCEETNRFLVGRRGNLILKNSEP